MEYCFKRNNTMDIYNTVKNNPPTFIAGGLVLKRNLLLKVKMNVDTCIDIVEASTD